jgi:hypothetical protein
MSLLLLFHGTSDGPPPEPEPTDGGSNFRARMAALEFVRQARPEPKPRKRHPDDFWWWE